MKITRLLLPACILLIAATGAFGDSSDPKIVMGGGGSCQSFTETSLTQTFPPPGVPGVDTGCQVDFKNEINDGTVTLDLLVVNVDTVFSGGLSCSLGTGSPLNTAFLSSPTSCTFEDETLGRSITPGSTYSLSFCATSAEVGCPNDSGVGFPPTIEITLAQTVIPAPEPASMLFLGVGLVGLLAGSKSRGLRGQTG